MAKSWQEIVLFLLTLAVVIFAFRWAVLRFVAWIDALAAERRRATASLQVYDKSDHHAETIEEFGLPEAHASHPAAFFLSWAIRKGLTSQRFERRCRAELAGCRAGAYPVTSLLRFHCDGCLSSDLLDDEGNAFARYYLDVREGTYWSDLVTHLQKDLPSEFHAEYSPGNEALVHGVIDARFRDWKSQRSG